MGQSQREETKERLIEAGKRVIFEKGFHRSRISDITQEAGLAHGTFYLYFKTKEDFLLELLSSVRRDMLSLMEKGIELLDKGRVEEGKELVFMKTFDLMVEEKELAKIFFFEAICGSERFQEFYKEGKTLFLERITQALSIMEEKNPEVKAHILLGTARHLIETAILGRSEVKELWRESLRELGLLS